MNLFVKGKDLLSQCNGSVEFSIPSEADLKSGKRPTVRIPYGTDKHQLWELGEPKVIPNSTAVVTIVATIDGKPGNGRCVTQAFGSQQVGFMCSSFIEAEGAESVNSVDLQYSNAPNGGTATGSPKELLDYVAGINSLLSGKVPLQTAASSNAAAPPAPKESSAPPSNANTAAPNKNPPATATGEPFKPSTDPKAIFGLMVGKQRPMVLPTCKHKDAYSKATFAPNQAYCFSELGTGLDALFGGLKEGLSFDDYEGMGIAPVTILINEQIYDTRVAENVTIFCDRDNIIQRIQIVTFLVSHNDVMKMLTTKYGKPAKEDWTIWSNRQTGAEVDRTPNYYWDFPGISVDYVSRTADLLNNKTPQGKVDIYTAAYSRTLGDYLKKRDGPQPGRKPM